MKNNRNKDKNDQRSQQEVSKQTSGGVRPRTTDTGGRNNGGQTELVSDKPNRNKQSGQR